MSRPVIVFLICIGVIGAGWLPGCATLKDMDLDDIMQGGDEPLDESTVTAGLKEALRIGTERAVADVGAIDGYLTNELIRIAIPEDMRVVTDKMRQIGLGYYVVELETGMNRAAEAAAGEAKAVFWEAITSMAIADAFGILNGDDTAATEYFRGRTQSTLEARYLPIVRQKMDEVGLARLYEDLLDTYNSIPLVQKPQLAPLDTYVTDKALDGLYSVLATEERKIREDPVARTTDLLRRVFGPS